MISSQVYDDKKLSNERISPPQNIALAGVGSPINDEVWRSSILNFAKRKPENTGIIKAT